MSDSIAVAALVGRTVELDAVNRALRAATAGHGGLLLVTGEAGIGKSRLLAEAARHARERGMAVLSGRAVAHAGPFRAVAEALVPAAPPALATDPRLVPYRSVLGRLLPGWPADAATDRRLVDPVVLLGEAVLELLRVVAEPGGVAVVLDDLHWADPDTTALLGYLSGRLASAHALLLGAARDDEGGTTSLADLRRAGRTLPLPRLTAAEIAELARDRAAGLGADAVDAVVRACDGLPLLVEELAVDGTAPGVPPTLAEITSRRMDTLPPPVQDVVHLAAVCSVNPTGSSSTPSAAERADRPEAVCEALEIVGRGLRRGDPDAAEEAFARAERLAGRRRLTVWRIRALRLGGVARRRPGRCRRRLRPRPRPAGSPDRLADPCVGPLGAAAHHARQRGR